MLMEVGCKLGNGQYGKGCNDQWIFVAPSQVVSAFTSMAWEADVRAKHGF